MASDSEGEETAVAFRGNIDESNPDIYNGENGVKMQPFT